MTRFFGGFIALEMALLWVLELALCFLVFYILLLPGDFAGFINSSAAASIRADMGALGMHRPTLQHAAILAGTVGMISMIIGMYQPSICLQTRRLLLSSVIAGLLAFPTLFLVSAVTDLDPSFILGEDALWPMKLLLSWILLLFVTRLGFRLILRGGILSRRIVLIGTPAQAIRTQAAIHSMRRGFFRLAEVVAPDQADRLSQPRLRAQGIWAVVISAESRTVPAVQRFLAAAPPSVRTFADVVFREQQLRRLDLDQLAPDWHVSAAGLAEDPFQMAVRRIADVVTSLAILVVALPVMLLAALLVRCDSPGPVFYRQERVGLAGRRFTLFKFRSMRVDAEANGPAWASQNDKRVTRTGALLRHTRIDELPQLLNVLRGEMSIIGPRPERPFFVDQFNASIPFYADRARVKPGITGWAQVNYPYGASVEDARQKLSYDLYYVKHRSLLLDLAILIATVRVIMFQEGAR